jgi:hypothetical protein
MIGAAISGVCMWGACALAHREVASSRHRAGAASAKATIRWSAGTCTAGRTGRPQWVRRWCTMRGARGAGTSGMCTCERAHSRTGRWHPAGITGCIGEATIRWPAGTCTAGCLLIGMTIFFRFFVFFCVFLCYCVLLCDFMLFWYCFKRKKNTQKITKRIGNFFLFNLSNPTSPPQQGDSRVSSRVSSRETAG